MYRYASSAGESKGMECGGMVCELRMGLTGIE